MFDKRGDKSSGKKEEEENIYIGYKGYGLNV